MKAEMILHSDLLDIVFDERNKEYGAYQLRKNYQRELSKSLLMVLGIVLTATLILYMKNGNDNNLYSGNLVETKDSVRLVEVKLPEEVVKPEVEKPVAKTVDHVTPVLDKNGTSKVPEIDDLMDAIISDTNIAGPPAEPYQLTAPVGNTGDGNGVKPAPEVKEPEIYADPEVRPEFPGGIESWRRFLTKNLRSPVESDEEYKVTVVVSFVVNEDGSITDLVVKESGGKEFDKEVVRVMNKSPKWVAGSQKGRKVKVYHAQPVTFVYKAE